jgi:fumarate hydratase class II
MQQASRERTSEGWRSIMYFSHPCLHLQIGGAGSYLEMDVYKPLTIFNVTHSITIMTDGCTNFRKFLIEGTKPNQKKIKEYVDRYLMLVTALSPVIATTNRRRKMLAYTLPEVLIVAAMVAAIALLQTDGHYSYITG